MSDVTRLFVDFEFTGLHQYTTPISVGICTQDREKTFYGEFSDYDTDQVDDWLQENVINKLLLQNLPPHTSSHGETKDHFLIHAAHDTLAWNLRVWLEQFDKIEFWVDCGPYDTMLLNNLICDWSEGVVTHQLRRMHKSTDNRFLKFGKGYPQLPKNVPFHTPYDLATLFKERGKDPDCNREQFILDHTVLFEFASEIRTVGEDYKHNALWDAKVMSACFEILQMLKA